MTETDTLPLSALQHLAFCPRQCALIHIERQWEENTLTAQGRVLHERAHDAGTERRANIRITRSLQLQSRALRLHGVADVVEYHCQPDGTWMPVPVEYKRGRPKAEPIDAVQLCAQAVCLEEMHATSVAGGAIFYGQTRRRVDIVFDNALRMETHRLSIALHALIDAGLTPPPEYAPKCRSCSLLELCRPRAVGKSASAHLARLFQPTD